MSYDKNDFEKYACLSVCYQLKYDFKEFKNLDKPDLQSKKYDIGIEVVRAINEHDGLTYSILGKYFGKGLSGEEVVRSVNDRNSKGKFKGIIKSENGVAIISSTKGMYDACKHRDLIVGKIKEKSDLLPSYTQYSTNGLYCFAHTGLIDESDYSAILKACQISAFSLIFIDCIDEILIWKKDSGCFVKHDIPTFYC